ncbi:hypothetical protein H7T43_13975 [Peribacillus simplex]|uniref:hypothetical protein n=1 Tax=Peribacillus simplex TaxID=1478 RepID=UPI002989C7A3|nr:hypothetical protein [Peribacillus simplex]MBX9956003.1 hypothetical protein [Peribacillus simplex]
MVLSIHLKFQTIVKSSKAANYSILCLLSLWKAGVEGKSGDRGYPITFLIQLAAYNGSLIEKEKTTDPTYLGGGFFIAWNLFVH